MHLLVGLPLEPSQLLAQPSDLELRFLTTAGLFVDPLLDLLQHLLEPCDQLVALQQHRGACEETQPVASDLDFEPEDAGLVAAGEVATHVA